MTVCHHINDATLMRFAAGDLDEAFAVVIASHIAMCGHCRENLTAAEEIGGEVLDGAEQIEMSANAFGQLMANIYSPGNKIVATHPDHASPRMSDTVGESPTPAPLMRVLGRPIKDVPWKFVAPGVRKHDLPLTTDTQSSLYMLNISPGKTVPEHGHGGAEVTLILSGAYQDNLGRFAAGDIADLDEHLEHQPRVEDDAPCICLVATEAPTKFKGFFSQLFQPMTGI